MPRPTGEEVARDILNYFLRNPQMADTLEGIARWRLMSETIHRSVEETNEALEWLAEQGFLSRLPRTGAGVIFRLNPDKRDVAETFLARLRELKAKGRH